MQKAKQGVKVEIITEDNEINRNADFNISEVLAYGGKVYINPNKFKLMHMKFCIIDERVIIKGSYNWTKMASSNYEEIDIFEDYPEQIDRQIKLFNELKEKILPRPDKKKKTKFISHRTNLTIDKVAGKFGFIDDDKNVLIPHSYDQALPFLDNWHEQYKGYYTFVKKGLKWGIIDNYGKIMHEFTIDSVETLRLKNQRPEIFWRNGEGSFYIFKIKQNDKVGIVVFERSINFALETEYDEIIVHKLADKGKLEDILNFKIRIGNKITALPYFSTDEHEKRDAYIKQYLKFDSLIALRTETAALNPIKMANTVCFKSTIGNKIGIYYILTGYKKGCYEVLIPDLQNVLRSVNICAVYSRYGLYFKVSHEYYDTEGNEIVDPYENPIKKSDHLQYLREEKEKEIKKQKDEHEKMVIKGFLGGFFFLILGIIVSSATGSIGGIFPLSIGGVLILYLTLKSVQRR